MAREKINRVTCRMTDYKSKELEQVAKQMCVSKSAVLNISFDYFCRWINGRDEEGADNERTKETKARKTKK